MRLQAMGYTAGHERRQRNVGTIYYPAVIPGCAPSDYINRNIGGTSRLVPVYESGCGGGGGGGGGGGNDSANAGADATAAQESSNVNLNQIQFNPNINVGSIQTSANVTQDVDPSVNVSAGAQSGASSQASSSAPRGQAYGGRPPSNESLYGRGFYGRGSTGGGTMPLNLQTRISATPQPQSQPQPSQPRTGETHITVAAPSSPGASPGPEPSQALPPSTPQNEDDIYLGPVENAEVQTFQDQLAGVEGVRDQSGAVILALLGVTALGIWFFKKQA